MKRVCRGGAGLASVALALCLSCTGLIDLPVQSDTVACGQSALSAPGSAALGVVPSSLPSRLGVGLFEDNGGTWMKKSGVKWDYRYAYFVEGWVDNWGNGASDGSFALGYMKESDAAGFIPVIEWYVMNGEAPAYDESKVWAKAQNATTMKDYFTQVKTLFTQAKAFGKPVLFLTEADGFGFLQQQAVSPTAAAAVASTGLAELGGLPNTVAGWGLAFLALRKSVGATNVVLGMHVAEWASGQDIAYGNMATPLQPEVDKVNAFLGPMGLAANSTGQTYDLLVGDPLDRDSDYYKTVKNDDRWWDASDNASIDSKSFNRYAEWLRLWNVATNRRWVLWQVPIGNSNSLNAPNTGQSRGGYKDNRAEYFFGPSRSAHLGKFADVGVMALLFGRGEGTQANYDTDTFTDGQLYLETHVAPVASAGGFTIARGDGSAVVTAGDAGGSDGGGGSTSTGGTSNGGAGATDGTSSGASASGQIKGSGCP